MMAKGVSAPFREGAPRSTLRPMSALSLRSRVYVIIRSFILFGLQGVPESLWKATSNYRYNTMYLLLFVAALVQYFATVGASPGYLIDARRAFNEANTRIKECSTSSKAWMCSYCSLVQPPRSKHCNECDKCVLQFDHHCIWLGTCIGQNNHCRFWWKDVIMILIILVFLLLLLFFHSYLVLTNQTICELVRRRRISYLQGILKRVYPFSKGIRQNLYRFYCARGSDYYMERVPAQWELEELARPYTVWTS